MSAPRRLIEEGGTSLEMALLRSAKDDDPPPDALPRAMIAAGVGGVAVSGGAAANVFANPASGLLKWAIHLLVVAACGLGGGAIFMGETGNWAGSSLERSAATLAGSEANKALPGEVLSNPADAPPGTIELTPPEPSEESAAAGSPGGSQKSASNGSRARATDPAEKRNNNNNTNTNTNTKPSLAEEVALLDGARRALMRGDAEGALRILEQHTRVFSAGALIADAAVLRIEALAARGDKAGAISNARAFLAAFPRDPHATHVQNILQEHQDREVPEQVGEPR